MVNSINSMLVNALFNQTANSAVSADLLAAWAKSKAGIGAPVADLTKDPNAPLAPVWTPGYTPGADVLAQRAFDGKGFFDLKAKLYSDLGATGDYQRLFALHTGLSTLNALAGQAENEKLTPAAKAKIVAQFERGLAEMQSFFGKEKFDDIRLAQGDRVDAAQTTLALPTKSEDYVTPILHRGGLYDKISGLDANAKFDIVAVSQAGTERRVSIDLAQMGAMSRSFGNVLSFINGKLAAAGASSRLEASDQTPKTSTVVLGGKTITNKYVGPKQYALKVDVRANERVSFEPVDADPAFYVVGQTSGGARLIKLSDVSDTAGLPVLLDRPGATADPIGANVATGWLGPGAPYSAAPAGVYEARSTALVSDGANNFETKLRAAGEAVVQLEFSDGRTLSVSTAWRSHDLENWRQRSGESEDVGMLDDLAERLTQLLHEQGVAAGVEVWQDGTDAGFSVLTGDGVAVADLSISGRAATLETISPAGMVGGLRDGIFARRFETQAVAATNDLFIGDQKFTFTSATGTKTITIVGGEDGIEASEVVDQLNQRLYEQGIAANASIFDDGGALKVRVDALHTMLDVSVSINEDTYDAAISGARRVGAGRSAERRSGPAVRRRGAQHQRRRLSPRDLHRRARY